MCGLNKPMVILLKRAYEPPGPDDGLRVLVDRLWPRGVSKDTARIDWWFKDIAPSSSLRKWFGHDPLKWDEFRKRYFQEFIPFHRIDQTQEVLAVSQTTKNIRTK